MRAVELEQQVKEGERRLQDTRFDLEGKITGEGRRREREREIVGVGETVLPPEIEMLCC